MHTTTWIAPSSRGLERPGEYLHTTSQSFLTPLLLYIFMTCTAASKIGIKITHLDAACQARLHFLEKA